MKEHKNNTDINRRKFFNIGGNGKSYGNDCYGNHPELRTISARTIKKENSGIYAGSSLNPFIKYLMFVR